RCSTRPFLEVASGPILSLAAAFCVPRTHWHGAESKDEASPSLGHSVACPATPGDAREITVDKSGSVCHTFMKIAWIDLVGRHRSGLPATREERRQCMPKMGSRPFEHMKEFRLRRFSRPGGKRL